MQRVFAMIRKVAKTDAPVLIEGESGTGKELIAKAIHRSGENFREKPFVAINCGAIPENLLESELFGDEKGSFTGADALKKGKIEYADGGTLFLDEVGELPLLLQVKLLRFLQERHVERVGGRVPITVTARVIAATNRELKREIAQGRFREDLYYLLGVVNLVAPPCGTGGTKSSSWRIVSCNCFPRTSQGGPRFLGRRAGGDQIVFLAGERAGAGEQGEARGHHEREEDPYPGGSGLCASGRTGTCRFTQRDAQHRREGAYYKSTHEMRLEHHESGP
jgi:hypothetical protein